MTKSLIVALLLCGAQSFCGDAASLEQLQKDAAAALKSGDLAGAERQCVAATGWILGFMKTSEGHGLLRDTVGRRETPMKLAGRRALRGRYPSLR